MLYIMRVKPSMMPNGTIPPQKKNYWPLFFWHDNDYAWHVILDFIVCCYQLLKMVLHNFTCLLNPKTYKKLKKLY